MKFELGKIAPAKDATPSTHYEFWLPGAQANGSGNVVDRSGNDNHATLQSAVTESTFWGNGGWFTSEAVAETGCEIPALAVEFDHLTDSLIWGFRYVIAASASTQAFIGNNWQGSNKGIQITQQLNGDFGFTIRDGTTTVSSNTGTVMADNTPHHATMTIDSPTKTMSGYKDSVIDGVTNNIDISTVLLTTQSPTPFSFGDAGSRGTVYCFAAQFSDVHFLVFKNSGLPSNTQEIINKLYSRPYYPITDAEITL